MTDELVQCPAYNSGHCGPKCVHAQPHTRGNGCGLWEACEVCLPVSAAEKECGQCYSQNHCPMKLETPCKYWVCGECTHPKTSAAETNCSKRLGCMAGEPCPWLATLCEYRLRGVCAKPDPLLGRIRQLNRQWAELAVKVNELEHELELANTTIACYEALGRDKNAVTVKYEVHHVEDRHVHIITDDGHDMGRPLHSNLSYPSCNVVGAQVVRAIRERVWGDG